MADNTIFFDIYKAVYDQLTGNWTTLPTIMANDDGAGEDLSSGFIEIEQGIMSGDRASINGATPKVRVTGAFTINIMTPQNEAVGKGLSYASQIGQYFNGANISNVQMFISSVGSARKVDKSPKGRFWLTPLICDFYYDTNITIV